MATATKFLGTGTVAQRLGVQSHHIVRLVRRGVLSCTKRVGNVRLFEPGDLPAIRRALISAGYLQPHARRRRPGRRPAALAG